MSDERPVPESTPEPGGPRTSGSLLSGAGVLVAGRYVMAGLAWVSTVIIVRQLSPVEWGEYSVVFSLLGIVGFIADLRLSRIVLEDVLVGEDDEGARVVGSYTGLRLVIGVVSYAVAMAVVGIGAAAGEYSRSVVVGTAIGGLNLIILSVAYGLILMFEARLWLRDVAVANVLGQVAAFLMVVGLTVAGMATLEWYVVATVANACVVLAWLGFSVRRGSRVRLSFERSRWGHWFREAAPLALGAALDTIYFRIDVLMLSIIATEKAAGIYNVGYKFSDLLGAVPIAVLTPALTLMVGSFAADRPAFRRTFRHTLVLLVVVAVGACIVFMIYAEDAVVFIYGEANRAGSNAARLLVVGQGLHFLTLLAFTTLVAAKRNVLYPIAMLVGVAVNVGLNLVLIPEYSYMGSGWATVITEVLVLAVLAVGVARVEGLAPWPMGAFGRTAVAGVLSAATGLVLVGAVPWPVGAAATVLVYAVAVHVLAPNGPGGLRAFAGEPYDDLRSATELGLDRPELGLPD